MQAPSPPFADSLCNLSLMAKAFAISKIRQQNGANRNETLSSAANACIILLSSFYRIPKR